MTVLAEAKAEVVVDRGGGNPQKIVLRSGAGSEVVDIETV